MINKTRVLLIEDNPGDARLIEEMLKESGSQFEIECTDHLSSGMERVKTDGFDLILLDLGLPDSQGLETLRQLNKIRPGVPIIVLTGLADDETGTQAVKEGAQDYLIKGQTDHYLLSRAVRYAIERKKAEDLIVAGEQKYRVLVETMNEGLGVQDRNGMITYINERACEMFGYSPEELIGRPMDVLFDEEGLKTFKAQMALRRQGKEDSYEIDWRRKDGSRVSTIVSPHVILDAEGNFDGSFGVFTDISKRKKAEEELQKSEARYRALAEAAPDMIFVIDSDDRVQYVNSYAARLMGSTPERVIGRPRAELFPPDISERQGRSLRGVFEKGQPLFNETPLSFAGREMWTSNWLVPMRDESGRVTAVMGISRDITNNKLVEGELLKREAFIKNILESVGEGFVVIDPEYRIITANRAYCEMQKTRLEDVIGRHCHEISHRNEEPCFMVGEECAPRYTFKTGEPQMTIHTHYDNDGLPIYIQTRAFPMKDAQGKVVSVIEVLNNITEKRTLEGQLRHAQKMEAIGTLAGGIAHDFNNMLNVIIGYASLMQINMSHDDPKMEQIKEILNAGDRAAHLTKGLLTFSRKQVMEVRRADLNEIIKGFHKMLTRIIGENIELTTIFSEQALTVRADIVQIEQVLMNLASNAKDAMPKGGVLAIETMPADIDSAFIRRHGYGEPGSCALIKVSDTGAGMDDKTVERIYEPFFTTKDFGKGTGLGLAIVYGIVKQHGGYITCQSEPGKGTTFNIYLPLIKEESEKFEKSEAEVPEGGTETVLVAEDDAVVRSLIKNILEGFGYRVMEAVDGEEAVKIFKENRDKIGLLLFDLIMPKKNGKDAYEDIKGIRDDIKAIFISGYAADIIQTYGIEEDIEFLAKPVSSKDLLRKVRHILGPV